MEYGTAFTGLSISAPVKCFISHRIVRFASSRGTLFKMIKRLQLAPETANDTNFFLSLKTCGATLIESHTRQFELAQPTATWELILGLPDFLCNERALLLHRSVLFLNGSLLC